MVADRDDTREEKSSRADLVVAWTADHGEPPPKGLSTRLLRLSAAWHAQAAVHGDLNRATLKQLKAIAIKGPEKPSSTCTAVARSRGAAPGTRLVRGWQGRSHVVDVHDDHVVYEGKSYRSLSAVARAITGARWSGPRFFGLTGP